MQKPGSFTVSLDFELYWGMRDLVTLKAYEENLLGVREAIPRMLELFQTYEIHVTWATVGFLFHEDMEALKRNFPRVRPKYENRALCPYAYIETKLSGVAVESERFEEMHFAKKLIEQIRQTPHQEIASHTYSHYYTREPAIAYEAFEADLKKAQDVASQNGLELRSLVFPRNQIDKESLSVLKKAGFKIYRGNPEHWAYREGEAGKTFLQRVYRFFDIYINLSGDHTARPGMDELGLTNAQSSMFLRPYSKRFAFLEKMKLHRVKRAMENAAKKGENFHLWWHPHNFGANLDENMANLEEILSHFHDLKKKYSMVSLNMRELEAFYE
jgi:peptidoglycan/xylan/chitin deacetylase (PgdA/CDA1 family)